MPRLQILHAIAAERERQIAKGYDDAHDNAHACGEIAMAAACYAATKRLYVDGGYHGAEHRYVYAWPFDEGQQPTQDRSKRRERLIKAAALIVAELERLERFGE